MDFQNPGKEKFEDPRKELESSKTKMTGYTNEKVNVKRQIQEIRVSSGTGLINLENSTRCLDYFDNTAKRQEQPHNRTHQSMWKRENNSLRDQQSQQHQSSSISNSSSNTQKYQSSSNNITQQR